MEDILASIRRILSEDEAAPPEPQSAASPRQPPEPEILALDPSMLVEQPEPHPESHPEPPHEEPAIAMPPPEPEAEPEPEPELELEPEPEPGPEAPPPAIPEPAAAPQDQIDMPPTPESAPEPPSPAPAADSLVGSAAAAAAASSLGSLLRTIGTRQGVGVVRGGPTIEDLVREELRPVLKTWLDANLPALVERLVRAEIERVVGRADF